MFEIVALDKVTENQVEILDYDWSWVYQRILKPFTNTPSSYFNIFVKDPNVSEHRVIPGVLSADYSVLKTEDAVAGLHKALGGDMLSKPRVYRSGNEICVSFMMKEFKIDMEVDTRANKMLFALMTDINPDEMEQKTALSFNLINSMAGSRSLTLCYGLLVNLFPANKALRPLSVNNVYFLGEFSTNLIHDNRLAVTYHDVSNVQSNIIAKMQLYKDTPVGDDFIELFNRSKFPKRVLKQINGYWEKLEPEWRNFYYFTTIVSYVTALAKNVNFEIRCRSLINGYVTEFHKHSKRVAVA